ncbi:MAG: hypothetical protein KGN79_03360, partial [Acidobacteriota bacterium]|nr:hypothetical protein [Acidobacteriota bacterium]
MRLAATGNIALLLASVAVRGQTAQAAKLSAQAVVLKTETITRSLGSSACPIGMQARHAFFAQRQLAGNQHTPQDKSINRAAMALRLTLTPQDKRHITSAWVTITGLSGKDVRLMPARNSYNAET